MAADFPDRRLSAKQCSMARLNACRVRSPTAWKSEGEGALDSAIKDRPWHTSRTPTPKGAKIAGGRGLSGSGMRSAVASRSEVIGWVKKGALLAVTPPLGFIGFVLWGYTEWRSTYTRPWISAYQSCATHPPAG
jgi:hypothetical protein